MDIQWILGMPGRTYSHVVSQYGTVGLIVMGIAAFGLLALLYIAFDRRR
ncbi:hypothetical protein [Tuwongella immobilis]|uniref:Uncharacterized protein n=1 Tax=Tuwongella immobilis TaxID=692036 RepID=A0A6C2YLB6_9BACT|nr:hypothetical protein [Tuwongella immobilis]VIP02101.1 unnamed protein product [Tuwongella immobilis]VTS00389.1 unnamed protein product [Tuwongella immobilis]